MRIKTSIGASNEPRIQDNTGADNKKIQEVLAGEAKAGWDLLEKEDNYRIKLQRDISNRENDKNLDSDPYATTVGASPILTYGLTATATLAIVSVILL